MSTRVQKKNGSLLTATIIGENVNALLFETIIRAPPEDRWLYWVTLEFGI